MIEFLTPLHAAHLASGGEWVDLPQFAHRFAPNAFVRRRRFDAACARL